jgi:hypothetical protein
MNGGGVGTGLRLLLGGGNGCAAAEQQRGKDQETRTVGQGRAPVGRKAWWKDMKGSAHGGKLPRRSFPLVLFS